MNLGVFRRAALGQYPEDSNETVADFLRLAGDHLLFKRAGHRVGRKRRRADEALDVITPRHRLLFRQIPRSQDVAALGVLDRLFYSLDVRFDFH